MTDMTPAPDAGAGPAPTDANAAQTPVDDDQGESQEREVCISYNPATGEVKVGLEPPEQEQGEAPGAAGAGGAPGGEEESEDEWMKPAKNLADALSIAKDLLTSGQAQDAESEAAFTKGYDSQSGRPPTGMSTAGMK
ncbi:MAG TPA: hypothetical protein VN878_05930 [Usitatibacter sp.]|nr:hypothetical protein [Usitatibacter sp.]